MEHCNYLQNNNKLPSNNSQHCISQCCQKLGTVCDKYGFTIVNDIFDEIANFFDEEIEDILSLSNGTNSSFCSTNNKHADATENINLNPK